MIIRKDPSPRFPNGRYLISVHERFFKREISIPIQSRAGGTIPIRIDHRTALNVAPNKKGAEEVETFLKSYLKAPDLVTTARRSLTFKDVLEHYNQKRTWGDGEYRKLLSEHGDQPIENIYFVLNDWVSLLRRTLTRRGDFYKSATINRFIAMAKAAVHEAYVARDPITRDRLIPENYLDGFPLLEEKNTVHFLLSKEQKDALWAALPDYWKPMYYLASRVPLRESEAVNIRREDLTRLSGFISIGKTKNGIPRQIMIWPELQSYAAAFLLSGAEYFFNMGFSRGFRPLGRIDRDTGRVIYGLKRSWATACRAAGVPRYTFHKTRQEAALNLYQEGWSIDEIMIIGGWESHKAFYRYFDRNVALQIKQKRIKLDLEWYRSYAEELKVA